MGILKIPRITTTNRTGLTLGLGELVYDTDLDEIYKGDGATSGGIAIASGTGDVVGPASAVNNRVVLFDGTTGKLIKDSGLTLSGTNTGDQTITLTGDVTGSGTGSFAATIANNSVTLGKMANVATGTVFYRTTAGTGSPEVQTLATLKTDLGLSGTNSGDQTITLTGDVTGSGTGSFAATIANNAVTLGKMATMATASFLGRNTAGTGNVEVLSVATVSTMLSLSGTNSGDETTSSIKTKLGVASSGVDGYLSGTDWTTFNSKEPAVTKGNLTESTSSVLTITGGSSSVIGSGVTIQVKQSSSTVSGYLSSTDWSTFNSKEPALTKGNLTESTSSVLTITGGSNAIIGSGLTIEVKQATSSVNGYLSFTDWSTFNNKQSALTFSTGLTNTSGTVTANLSVGVSGGQSVIGGSASGNSLTLTSTSNATKGNIIFGSAGLSVYDEVNNRFGININAPSAALHIVTNISAESFWSDRYVGTTAAGAPGIILRKARGTSSSPTAAQSGDTLGVFGFRGYGSTAFSSGSRAALLAYAAETWTDTAQGTYLAYSTTINGSTTLSEKLRIDNDGNVLIGTTTNGGFKLDVNGTVRAVTSIDTPILRGGTGSSGTLTLSSTSNATKGKILFGTSAYDEANNRLGIGTASPSYPLHIVGGTLTDGQNVKFISATMPTIITATMNAINYQITSAGSSSFTNRAYNIDYLAGYTGSSQTNAFRVSNAVAGTGAAMVGGVANLGTSAATTGTTTGTNIGTYSNAANGNINIGVLGRAITNKNSATNIGVMGLGINTGTSPIEVGGFFGMQITDPTISTSAALMCDNGSEAVDIFVARDNGTAVFKVTDNGNTIVGGLAAISTSATDGYLYLPTCAGIPTGTPTSYTGKAAMVIDTTNNKAYVYSGGAWRILN